MAKLCYMDIDSFIVYVKSEDVYEHLAGMLRQEFAWSKATSRVKVVLTRNQREQKSVWANER